jgi:hypothetical protein
MSDNSPKKRLSELVDIEIDNDSLLEDAVRRAKREAAADNVEFFRHGSFGSHNS